MDDRMVSIPAEKQLPFVSKACERRLQKSLNNIDPDNRRSGIFPRNGSFAAVIGFQKRLYHLGMYEEYVKAVEARMMAEELLYADYKAAYEAWLALPEYWKREKPFSFIPPDPGTVRKWIREERKILRQIQLSAAHGE